MNLRARDVVLSCLSVALVLALVAVTVRATPVAAQEATVPQTGGGLAGAERAAAGGSVK
jgi:hypothetical protein